MQRDVPSQSAKPSRGAGMVGALISGFMAAVLVGGTLVLLALFDRSTRQDGVPLDAYWLVPFLVAAIIGWALRPGRMGGLVVATVEYAGLLVGASSLPVISGRWRFSHVLVPRALGGCPRWHRSLVVGRGCGRMGGSQSGGKAKEVSVVRPRLSSGNGPSGLPPTGCPGWVCGLSYAA